MAPLPAQELDLDQRFVVRVPADPHVRVDTNDYSIDPAMVGRRVEVRISQRHVVAVCLDTGELAGRHERSAAKHRTITALEHARALCDQRQQPATGLEVECKPCGLAVVGSDKFRLRFSYWSDRGSAGGEILVRYGAGRAPGSQHRISGSRFRT